MKRIVIAVLLSFIGPGIGQLYNRDYKQGIILLVLAGVLFFLPLFWLAARVSPMLPDPRQEVITQEMVQEAASKVVQGDKHVLNLISFAFLGVWAYAITQAYFGAKAINEKNEPKPLNPSEPEDL